MKTVTKVILLSVGSALAYLPSSALAHGKLCVINHSGDHMHLMLESVKSDHAHFNLKSIKTDKNVCATLPAGEYRLSATEDHGGYGDDFGHKALEVKNGQITKIMITQDESPLKVNHYMMEEEGKPKPLPEPAKDETPLDI